MRAAILQPSFIPWRGFFDIIASVDVFVFYDDAQYTKRDWRTRNIIKTAKGPVWLIAPVRKETAGKINETRLCGENGRWRKKILETLKHAYASAPYFMECFQEFSDILTNADDSLCDLDIRLTQWAMSRLNISTKCLLSSDLRGDGSKTSRLINILQKIGANSYLSGPSAKAYIEPELFRKNGISLEYKTYDYDPYPQLHGEFLHNVSVLDLLFNTGPEAWRHIKSKTPDIRVL